MLFVFFYFKLPLINPNLLGITLEINAINLSNWYPNFSKKNLTGQEVKEILKETELTG